MELSSVLVSSPAREICLKNLEDTYSCSLQEVQKKPMFREPAFLGNLMRPLRQWDMIIIEGSIPKHAKRTEITFESSKQPSSTIPLLFSVHFREETIVCNSKIDHKWGVEEISEHSRNKKNPMPLKAGRRFVFTVFMNEDSFLISLNKKYFCTYNYRTKLKAVRTIRVNRDVFRVTRVDHRSFFPTPWPKYITPAMVSFDTPEPINPGWVIIFGGVAYETTDISFDVRLFEMGTQRIRLLMRFERDQIRYYENSNKSGYDLSLSHEVVQDSNPIEHMKPFRVAIAVTETNFRIAINGDVQTPYPYSSPIRALSGLKLLEQKARVVIYSVDYVQLEDARCLGFSVLSKLNFNLT